jgi:hypothetical protein
MERRASGVLIARTISRGPCGTVPTAVDGIKLSINALRALGRFFISNPRDRKQ